jgi:hypothetical protein
MGEKGQRQGNCVTELPAMPAVTIFLPTDAHYKEEVSETHENCQTQWQ